MTARAPATARERCDSGEEAPISSKRTGATEQRSISLREGLGTELGCISHAARRCSGNLQLLENLGQGDEPVTVGRLEEPKLAAQHRVLAMTARAAAAMRTLEFSGE